MSDSQTHFMGQRLLSSPPNTLFPDQPGYQRPDRADDCQPTTVTAPAINVKGTVVEQAHALMEHGKTARAKFLDDIKKDRHRYSDEGYREQVAGFIDSPAAKAVDTAVSKVRDLADKTGAQVEKIRKGLSPNGDTAAELRATRFWDRTKPLLDNAKEGAFGRAQKLIANADREQLGVLLQELPSYLEAHGQATEWIDTAVGQAVPEYAKAVRRHQKAKQALTIAERNAQSLHKSFSDEGHRPVLTQYNPKYDPDR